ncbi:hypothetical protein KFK09_023646 [Dendrobium nobile]|uniref:Uncharacterized protein n=1 Tax=Dendrobium nobile TaxID=94219 RepID=A0A8T3ABM3_DENNO|nr:hypothetical protein KFK09_023646 [Dendrobium nobile]
MNPTYIQPPHDAFLHAASTLTPTSKRTMYSALRQLSIGPEHPSTLCPTPYVFALSLMPDVYPPAPTCYEIMTVLSLARIFFACRHKSRRWFPSANLQYPPNLPGVTGNGATFYFLVFAILAGVVGAASKFAGASHVRAWRSDSLGAAAASAVIAWAITALAFGLACKEIHVGGYRGWRLKALEAFIIILCFTQLLYVMLLHAGMVSGKYGPAYRDHEYGVGGHGHGGAAGVEKGTRV